MRVALRADEPVFECSMPRPHHYRLPGSLIGEEKGSERTFDTSTGDPECTTCKVYELNVHVHAM